LKLYPAIDIAGGQVVRLAQGDFARQTAYSSNPLEVACRFAEQGARRLHIVDLDAAKSGVSHNRGIIGEICRATGLPVEAGGGVRSFEAAEALFVCGVQSVVVGTKAVTDPAFLGELARAYPNRVSVGLDSKGGYVMTHGWIENSGTTLEEALHRFDRFPLASAIVTDIGRDGMLGGIDSAFYAYLQSITALEVTASGGIGAIEDLEMLARAGVKGAILGKSLYEERLDLAEAIKAFEEEEDVSEENRALPGR